MCPLKERAKFGPRVKVSLSCLVASREVNSFNCLVERGKCNTAGLAVTWKRSREGGMKGKGRKRRRLKRKEEGGGHDVSKAVMLWKEKEVCFSWLPLQEEA